ncbi:MAG: hypothetical protein AB1564_09595 [Chloroflexota bacterium]
MSNKRHKHVKPNGFAIRPVQKEVKNKVVDPKDLERLPVSYQEVQDYFAPLSDFNPFTLRAETFRRIEALTKIPLICYVTKTTNLPPSVPAYIDDNDLTGFGDLVSHVDGKSVDIILVSNGGSAEVTERIVSLLRERFEKIRFLLPGNAYSAATLMCFAGDEIVMDSLSTLGPIDPQINGIPARAILRSFENLEKRLKAEGPQGITAYLPLIQKYDLHLLEICRSAEELSTELARSWLGKYLMKGNAKVEDVVKFFASYDHHKSHGRGITRQVARENGLSTIMNAEDVSGLADLLRSLRSQYDIWFDKTPFYKNYEDARGTNWGRQIVLAVKPAPK